MTETIQPRLLLHEAMNVYFEAKARMFAADASFRLLHVGPLRCFHNHPGWPEADGFYAVDGENDPQTVVDTVHAYQPSPDHMITVFTAAPDALTRPYAERNYNPLPDPPQPFMVKSLSCFPSIERQANALIDVSVCRVETPAQMDFLNSGDETIMQPRHLHDSIYRYYYIEQDNKPVCWGRCIAASSEAIYVAGMETAPDYRRRGLAAALLHQMHTDAANSGAEQSVLCSTTIGFPLYQKVGYTKLALMQAFVPQ